MGHGHSHHVRYVRAGRFAGPYRHSILLWVKSYQFSDEHLVTRPGKQTVSH